MTRPEDIPADVWDSSAEVAKTWPISDMTLTELIARAILAYGQRRAEKAEAEVERLRAQSETMRKLLHEADKRIVWEHHGLGHDFTDRVEDALND